MASEREKRHESTKRQSKTENERRTKKNTEKEAEALGPLKIQRPARLYTWLLLICTGRVLFPAEG